MEKNSNPKPKVCVTGGAGYVASWLVKKLLERGYTVHATLRNLEDTSKVGLLRSLPGAETNLVLFQADIYKPGEFEAAIQGCEFVCHVATPWLHDSQSSQFKNTAEAAVAGVKSIVDSCIRSQTVKRLVYTASVMASSPLARTEDGLSFKSCIHESCWTPLDVSFTHSDDFTMDYVNSKTLSEKAVLSYNEFCGGKLEVVSLPCALVGGETLLSYLPISVEITISQLITGKPFPFMVLRLLQELLGSVPLVHIEDVCEAHIFCLEKPSMKGRFLCVGASPTVAEMAHYFRENYPELEIPQERMVEGEGGNACDNSKLIHMGFEYKFDLKKILDDSVKCGRRLGAIN